MSNQQQSNQQVARCPRCGGRLFQESELRGSRRIYFWECSLGCSRQWSMEGKELSYQSGKRRVRIFREVVPAV